MLSGFGFFAVAIRERTARESRGKGLGGASKDKVLSYITLLNCEFTMISAVEPQSTTFSASLLGLAFGGPLGTGRSTSALRSQF